MKRQRFTEEQIIAVLKVAEAGATEAQSAPRHWRTDTGAPAGTTQPALESRLRA